MSNVKAIKNGQSYSVLVDGKVACVLATGGCHRFRTELEAEVFGRQYARGYTGGSYLDPDVEKFIAD